MKSYQKKRDAWFTFHSLSEFFPVPEKGQLCHLDQPRECFTRLHCKLVRKEKCRRSFRADGEVQMCLPALTRFQISPGFGLPRLSLCFLREKYSNSTLYWDPKLDPSTHGQMSWLSPTVLLLVFPFSWSCLVRSQEHLQKWDGGDFTGIRQSLI